MSGEQDLILTLETFFANMQRRKVTAAALGCHPNTLDHRLEGIENILGAKLDHAAWIAKLEIALKLQGTGERSRQVRVEIRPRVRQAADARACCRQFTPAALHARATVALSTEFTPYRSFAAWIDARRALG
ncbi:hypothetical protein WL77_14255 [Burkholderia ubonensis]|nr:hypothetical protein WL77_14255 [Burkholderia ubonensis]KWE72928.1 hypothetical protein WL79_17690 [Burkholderia ubonensis]